MTRIYEALQNADQERTAPQVKTVSPPPASHLPKSLEGNLLALYQRLEAKFDGQAGRIVEFVGAQTGDDSSRIAFHFGLLAASQLSKRILFLTIGSGRFSQRLVPGVNGGGWEAVLREEASIEDLILPVGEKGMSASRMASSEESLSGVLASQRLRELLDALRERYDLILVDAPPFGDSSGAARISPFTDGVIIVVEAEKTRWQVIKHGIEQIEAARGSGILGIILNKQHHYIPGWVYRRLL